MRNCRVAADVNSTEPRKNVHPATAGVSAVSRLRGTPIAKASEPSANPTAVGRSSRGTGEAAVLTSTR
jgi:hypothetical protein